MRPERIAELRNETRSDCHYHDDDINECLDEIERLRAENEKANERANRWEMTHDEAIDVMQSHLDRVCGERDAALARVKKLESTIQLERRMRDNLLGLMWHESSREFRLCEEAMYRLPPGLLAIAKDALKGGAE